jgi:hypothetical protein
MKKILLNSLLLVTSLELHAENLLLQNVQFRTENDGDFGTDRAYSYGSDLSVLFYRDNIKEDTFSIPFIDNFKVSDNYFSFSYAQQIYTPDDIESKKLVKNDRPYAGYMYLQAGLFQSYKKELNSLIFQIGMIGPSTKMQDVQKFVHDLIGSPTPQGWNHQLGDELTLQINYNNKRYFDISKYLNFNSAFISNYGFDLGNVSTKVYGGGLLRFGSYIPKDYGCYVMDNGNYNNIPLNHRHYISNKFHYTFNLSFQANLIARNIFLDGNSFKDSHRVDKNNVTLEGGYGITLSYKHFSFDYLRKHTTKEFKKQDYYSSYGSFIFSYNY